MSLQRCPRSQVLHAFELSHFKSNNAAHCYRVKLGVPASAVADRAGLGDVVVPGLLACLALRFDASRATDMRARAAAAAEALQRAVGALGVRLCYSHCLAHVLCGVTQGTRRALLPQRQK